MIAAVVLGLGIGGAAPASAHIYWANYGNGSIGRTNPDGSDLNQSFITGASSPAGVAVDRGHLYWGNYNGNRIGRANLDGSGVNQSFITGITMPHGVAVTDAYVFWNDGNGSWIGRANLDGSAAKENFITSADRTYGLAVGGGYVYWTNFGDGSIRRANLNGADLRPTFITGASTPVGVAVDSAHIYWTNGGTGKIGRANLDGTGVDQSFITGVSPTGLAVDAAHLYWTDYGAGTIGRANLDGSDANATFFNGASQPYALAVDLPPLPKSPAGPAPAALPDVTGVGQSARTWRAGTGLVRTSARKRRLPVGTTFRFSLNTAATARLVFTRRVRGRRVGRKCRAPSKRNRHRRRCKRTVTAGELILGAHTGVNRVRFQGRLSRRKRLKPGRYKLTITAVDSAGRRSAPRSLRFRIVKG